jgi:hypothetical protein
LAKGNNPPYQIYQQIPWVKGTESVSDFKAMFM